MTSFYSGFIETKKNENLKERDVVDTLVTTFFICSSSQSMLLSPFCI